MDAAASEHQGNYTRGWCESFESVPRLGMINAGRVGTVKCPLWSVNAQWPRGQVSARARIVASSSCGLHAALTLLLLVANAPLRFYCRHETSRFRFPRKETGHLINGVFARRLLNKWRRLLRWKKITTPSLDDFWPHLHSYELQIFLVHSTGFE